MSKMRIFKNKPLQGMAPNPPPQMDSPPEDPLEDPFEDPLGDPLKDPPEDHLDDNPLRPKGLKGLRA